MIVDTELQFGLKCDEINHGLTYTASFLNFALIMGQASKPAHANTEGRQAAPNLVTGVWGEVK